MISVIVLLDGKSKYNAAALNSILAQGSVVREILLIPLAGNGELPEYAAELAGDRAGVTLLPACANVADAINLGVSSAAGDYVHFCTGREIPEPGAYDRLLEEMGKTGADAVCFGWRDSAGVHMCGSGFRGTGNMQAFLEMILTDPGAEGDYAGYGGQLWNKLFRSSILYIEGTPVPADPEGAGLLELIWQSRLALQCRKVLFHPGCLLNRPVPVSDRLGTENLDLPALIRQEREVLAETEAVSPLAYRRMRKVFFDHMVRLLLVCREQKLVKMAAALEQHLVESVAPREEAQIVQLCIREEYQKKTISGLKRDTAEQTKKLQQMEKQAENLRADRTFLQNKTQSQLQRIEGLEADRTFLKNKTERQSQRIEGLEADRTFLKNKTERQSQRIEGLEADRTFLKAKTERQQNKIDALQAELTALKARNGQLETALAEYRGSFLAHTGLRVTRLCRKMIRKIRSWLRKK